jgi:hypothetical protein
MKALVHLAQPARCDVRVDLRRGYVGVSEHRLHRAEIGATVEQVGREGVAEAVRRHAAVERCFSQVTLQELPDRLARQRDAACRQEDLGTGPVPTREGRAREPEVVVEAGAGVAAERDDPLATPLSDHANAIGVEVEVALTE